MLSITIPSSELFNEETQEFISLSEVTLELEHSLVSLSKWESKTERPFLDGKEKSAEDILEYVKAMTITPGVPDDIFVRVSRGNVDAINEYLSSKQTATWFSESDGPKTKNREIVTSELIYYWMTVFHIPFECETWNLNRLFTLIRVCNLKQEGPKKMGRRDAAARQRDLNAQRKAQLGTKG